MTPGILRAALLWSCAGVAFNLTQRLLDHFLDSAFAAWGFTWLQ